MGNYEPPVALSKSTAFDWECAAFFAPRVSSSTMLAFDLSDHSSAAPRLIGLLKSYGYTGCTGSSERIT